MDLVTWCIFVNVILNQWPFFLPLEYHFFQCINHSKHRLPFILKWWNYPANTYNNLRLNFKVLHCKYRVKKRLDKRCSASCIPTYFFTTLHQIGFVYFLHKMCISWKMHLAQGLNTLWMWCAIKINRESNSKMKL